MGLFKNVLGTIIKEVAERNMKNESVKTADSRVFDALKYKLTETETKIDSDSSTRSRTDMYRDYYEKVLEAKRENEASQEVETADGSVYNDMLEQIEVLKRKVESQNSGQAPDLDLKTSPVGGTSSSGSAMTSSGGSIQLRMGPEMGAPKSNVFIPNNSAINILEYSDNQIILDGQESRFALVEYQGQRGWVLESYLR